MAAVFVLIANPASSFEPDVWLERNLTACRFSANQDACLETLRNAVNAKRHPIRISQPAKAEGETFKAKSLRRFPEYLGNIDTEGAISDTGGPFDDLFWLGDERRDYVVDQNWRMTALMTAQSRVAFQK